MDRPESCRGYGLDPIAESFSVLEGTGDLGVLVVVEALGEKEARDGLPLRGDAPAGAVFQRTCKALNIHRPFSAKDALGNPTPLAVTNVIRCRPPKNLLEHMPYEIGAINHCQAHFKQVVDQVKPRVMLAMGNVALRTLTGYAGKKRQVTNVRGFYLDGCRYPIPVIPTYHPA